jgi:tripartite-type tricarboxylate transporter receptor subunit TctC
MFGFHRRVLIASMLACLLAALSAPSAGAANYPDRPIRIIIPYTAGGVAETIVRLLAVTMEQKLGQKFVIEGRPGAAGNIGTLEVARAEPDGYTVLVAATNNFIINQFLTKMPIDPMVALTPVARLADIPLVMFANPSVSAKNFGEFVAYAKANPGKLNYGTPSAGTVNHLFMERLRQTTGIDIVHVPYRGSPQAVMALLANDIQLFPIGLAAGMSHLRDGKLTALAVAAERRLPMLPDVPTVIESGFAGFTAANWWGMAVPKGTPDAIVQQLNDAVQEALKQPNVVARFTALGMLIPADSREKFLAGLKADAEVWSRTITRGNITMQ